MNGILDSSPGCHVLNFLLLYSSNGRSKICVEDHLSVQMEIPKINCNFCCSPSRQANTVNSPTAVRLDIELDTATKQGLKSSSWIT